jgi:hypothetical protein
MAEDRSGRRTDDCSSFASSHPPAGNQQKNAPLTTGSPSETLASDTAIYLTPDLQETDDGQYLFTADLARDDGVAGFNHGAH